MKKFTVALDGLKLSPSALQYAVSLAKHSNAHLVGAFLNDFTHQSYTFTEAQKFIEDGAHKTSELDAKDQETRNLSVKLFETACIESGIQHTVHNDKSVAYQELLHETIYSDLLIVAASETFSNTPANGTSDLMREILADTECPVVMVPAFFTAFEKIMIMYDGDPSSVYAIKMFSYLLSGLDALPIEVLTVKSERLNLHVPDNRLMKEFMKRHFTEVKYTVLYGEPEEEIVSYLQQSDDNCLVILGAYSRSRVSRLFKKSMADYIMSKINYSVFVAHRR